MSTDPDFKFNVQDVFVIAKRGTVVTEQVESGTLYTGDEVTLQHAGGSQKVKVTGIEMFHKVLDQANPGDTVGLLLENLERNEVQRGDQLLGSGSGQDFSWKP